MNYSVVLCWSLITMAVGQNGDELPKKIQELATPKAEKAFSAVEDRQRYIEGFADGFKSGLKSPDGTVTFGSNDREEAYVAGTEKGRDAALSQPGDSANRITLLDFGYTKITATGYVRHGHEQSEFRPQGKKEVWWLTLVVDEPKPYSATRNGMSTMTGYLSPKKENSGYGHFGAYDREFVVIKKKKHKPQKQQNAE
jgi:hypothetical protein